MCVWMSTTGYEEAMVVVGPGAETRLGLARVRAGTVGRKLSLKVSVHFFSSCDRHSDSTSSTDSLQVIFRSISIRIVDMKQKACFFGDSRSLSLEIQGPF